MRELKESFVVAGQGCVFGPGEVLRTPLVLGPDVTFVTDEQVEATTTLTNTGYVTDSRDGTSITRCKIRKCDRQNDSTVQPAVSGANLSCESRDLRRCPMETKSSTRKQRRYRSVEEWPRLVSAWKVREKTSRV